MAGFMVAAYFIYFGQALGRGRQARERTQWGARELYLAGLGMLMLATGAFFAVRATERIVEALGISELAGGLFITGPMAVLPELFAAWSVGRSGQMTSAIGSVIGDHAVTMTIAFLPLALVATPLGDFRIFAITFAFVAIMPALYAGFIQWGWREPGFKLWQTLVLLGVYLSYLAIMILLLAFPS
jgi:cation:H+ antiporter